MEQQQTMRIPNKMETLPVNRLLIGMAAPVMLSMFIQACYNIVDSIFVSRLSENALTAVSLAFPIQMLMISVAVGTGVGMNSFISRRLGERRYEEANLGASNGLFLLALSALLFTVLGLTLTEPFFRLFTDDPEIVALGVDYLSICMTYCFGVFLQIGCERILQATGNTLYPMLMQLSGAITNIILDPILIFGYLGFPAMGIAGAAIATVIGQMVGMLLSLCLIFFKEHDVKLRIRGFRPDARIIRDIYAVGAPSIVMQSIGTVMTFGLNKILILFTPTAVSVLGIYFKMNSFLFMPVFALNGAALSIIAYNFGARLKKRVTDTLKTTILYGLGIMTLGIVLFQLFSREMLLLFEASPDMLRIGVPALRIISLSFPGAAVGIACSTFFQALGKGTLSMLMSLTRQLFAILPIAYLLAELSGLSAVWFAFPIAELVSFALCMFFLVSVHRKMIRPLDDVLPEGNVPVPEGE
ncbi:MAG TPA: MATE family efflux transporter [Feifaniaceae bacterium]|nr:MATE family efflux transporter [Feifaniaceae bacterium]